MMMPIEMYSKIPDICSQAKLITPNKRDITRAMRGILAYTDLTSWND
jgi:hypothetical protein